ncbi:MAG: enoyl-CoA hydratase [Pirellulales bacterium]
MAFQEIIYDVRERVATLALNRPDKLNAWTATMEQEVLEALTSAERDENVRVIVLTGAGRGFCAGADMGSLNSVASEQGGFAEIEKRLRAKFVGPQREGAPVDFQKTYSYLLDIKKPILGAINGAAAGLGMVIALYCDIRFASDKAKFSTAFSRRGLIAEYGMSWMLPRIVGIANALDLLYSARLVEADEALRMGLVSRVFPQESFESDVRKYAVELANAVSPRSMRIIKRQVYEGLLQSLGESIDAANEEMLGALACEDFKEGVAHFLEKRAPAFTGK